MYLCEKFDYENDTLFGIYLVFLLICLPPTSSYFLVSRFDILPNIKTNYTDSFVEADSTSTVLIRLDKEANHLKESLSNPKDLRISEIENILARTLDFSNEMRGLLVDQKEIIYKLNEEVKIEKQKAEESQKLAREIQTLTKKQLEAVKLLITEDAKLESNESFYKGIIVSFPIGLLASFLASLLLRRFGASKRSKENLIDVDI